MLEVHLTGCFASTEALDALAIPAGAVACRIAPDELMLIGPAGDVEDRVRELDSDAVVLDLTDGWCVAECSRESFARLSEIELPAEGFVQGDVARVPARVIAEPDRILLFVPAMYENHLRGRIEAAS